MQFSGRHHKSVREAIAVCTGHNVPCEELSFLCDNFHVDHCGALIRPCPDMLQHVEGAGYSVTARFPSTVVLRLLEETYPTVDISATVWKFQRGSEMLEVFEIEGLDATQFAAAAQNIDHIALSPNVLDKKLVQGFQALMSKCGMQQTRGGINPKEILMFNGKQIQGITLIYYTQSLCPGSHLSPSLPNLEICMAGMHHDLLQANV